MEEENSDGTSNSDATSQSDDFSDDADELEENLDHQGRANYKNVPDIQPETEQLKEWAIKKKKICLT